MVVDEWLGRLVVLIHCKEGTRHHAGIDTTTVLNMSVKLCVRYTASAMSSMVLMVGSGTRLLGMVVLMFNSVMVEIICCVDGC